MGVSQLDFARFWGSRLRKRGLVQIPFGDRGRYITGTRIGSLLGWNKYDPDAVYKIWSEMTGRKVWSFESTEKMDLSVELERGILAAYSKKHGIDYWQPDKTKSYVENFELGAFGGSTDGLLHDGNEFIMAEVKNVNYGSYKAITDGWATHVYRAQLSLYMYLFGIPKGRLIMCIDGERTEDIHEVLQNDLIDQFFQARKEFMDFVNDPESHMEPVGFETLKELYPKSVKGLGIQMPEYMIADVRLLDKAKEQLTKAEEEKEKVEATFKNFMKDKEILLYGNEVVATWRTINRKDGSSYRQFNFKGL